MGLHSFRNTDIHCDENGLLWVYDAVGNIVCEAFYKTVDQTSEEMMDAGYIPVPYKFEGETVYVELDPED